MIGRKWQAWAAVGILLWAWWLRVHGLNAPDYWSDEAYTLYSLRAGTLAGVVQSLWRTEGTPPLFFWLMLGWTRLGSVELFGRALPALLGVVAVAGAMRLGREAGGREAGWLAGGWLAVSYLMVQLSRQIRGYPLALVWVEAILWLTHCLIRRGRWRDVALWVAASAAGLYTSYFTVWVIAVSGLTVMVGGRRWRGWQARLAAMGAGELFALISLWPLLRAQLAWDAPSYAAALPLSPALGVVILDAFTLGGTLRQWPLAVALAGVMGVAIASSAGAVRAWRSGGAGRLIPVFVFGPVAANVLFSLGRPIFLPHYLSAVVPPLAVMLALGVRGDRFPKGMLWRRAALVGVLITGVWPYHFPHRAPWGAVAATVAARAQAGEGLVFVPLYNRVPFELKYNGPPLATLGLHDYTDYQPTPGQKLYAATPDEVEAVVGGLPRWWLVQAADWPQPTVPCWAEAGRWQFEEVAVVEYVRGNGCR